jgi:hypothetical protein
MRACILDVQVDFASIPSATVPTVALGRSAKVT